MPAILTNNDQDAEDDNGEMGGKRDGRGGRRGEGRGGGGMIKYACHADQ